MSALLATYYRLTRKHGYRKPMKHYKYIYMFLDYFVASICGIYSFKRLSLRRGWRNANREERSLLTVNEHRSDVPFRQDRPKSTF